MIYIYKVINKIINKVINMDEPNEFDDIIMEIDAQIDSGLASAKMCLENDIKFESECKCILGKVCSGCGFLCNCFEHIKNTNQNMKIEKYIDHQNQIELDDESTICGFDSVDSLECVDNDDMINANNSDNSDNSDNYSDISIIIDEHECAANITYCDIFSEYAFSYITKHDMDTVIASINYMKSIDIELQNLHSFKKYNCIQNKSKNENDYCWCCLNYTVIHYSCIRSFISKYICDDIVNEHDNKNIFEEKKNVIISNYFFPKPSSKLIKILYRLHPDFFDEFDISKIKALKYINKSYIKSADSYEHIFENYFYSENNTILKNEYESCSICLNNMCAKHLSFNKYYRSNCEHCAKKWNICPWCLESKFHKLYNPLYNKLLYSHSLCNIFHKNT